MTVSTETGTTEQGRGARVDVTALNWRPYGRNSDVLSTVNFSAEPGERILIAGPSGCGKSTLLRVIAGVLTSADGGEISGSVQVDGKPLQLLHHDYAPSSSAHAAPSIGLLVQDPTDAMVAATVGRDVAFGPENRGVERSELWRQVERSLEAVVFPYGVDRSVSALSGGEGQRLALAGVLALTPRLIVLDEPTSMLDPVTAARVRNAIWAAVASTGATVIVVEHHLDNWLPEIDRVIVMDAAGSVAADGPAVETLRAHSATLAVLGVWVPGASTPVPLVVDAGLLRPAALSEAACGFAENDGAQPPVVELIDVSAGYAPRVNAAGERGERGHDNLVLSGISTTLRAGEFLAIVGPSGAGKSTLSSLFAGLTEPHSGTVRLRATTIHASMVPEPHSPELPPSRWSSRRIAAAVGWVPQQAELAIVARTVRDDAASTCRALGVEVETAESRVDSLLALVGLTASATTDPHQLSGGELRRLALVGAVAHGPSVLVLDEPTVGQDRHTWAAVAGIILSARDAGAAVVVATHDPQLIALADRVLRLEGGRIAGEARAVTTIATADQQSLQPDEPLSRLQPGRALIGSAGPLSLLAVSVLLVVGALFITDLRVAALAVGVELVLAPVLCGWRQRFSVKRLAPGLLAIASVGFSNWLLSSGHDLSAGALAGLRVAFFVLPGVVIASSIDPFTLGDHLAQRLHLPARPVVAAVAAMQRLESLREQFVQLAQIRRVRGLDTSRSPAGRIRSLAALTFALFIQSLRQAGRMAQAMDARGFSTTRAGGARRTWAEPAHWLRADTIVLALGVTVASLPIVLPLSLAL